MGPIIAAYVEIDPIFMSCVIHCGVSYCIDYLLYAFVDRTIFTGLYGIHCKYFNNRYYTLSSSTCQRCLNSL